MIQYAAYGLTIQSALELPELPRSDGDSDASDVVFRLESLDPVPESIEGTGRRRIEATPEDCRLTYESIGTFLVADGSRILFDPVESIAPGATPRKVVRRLLANELLGLVLHQHGVLVVHASAVAVDGAAAIFLGPKGAGKSTTAAAFHECGHTTLEDDLVGIRLEDGQPVALPGVPQLRLCPDAIDALAVGDTTAPETTGDSTKRYKRVDTVREPVALQRCYRLRDGTELSLEAVSPREQVFELISQTYTGGLLADTETTDENFRLCSSVASTTAFRDLQRPRDHELLPSLVELVANDLRAADGEASTGQGRDLESTQ